MVDAILANSPDLSEREKWLIKRRQGIGGSDAPVVCEMSPWMSPFLLYLDKRGELEPSEMNEPMRWGSLLEPVIRQRYAEVTGVEVAVPKEILVHPKHPFMIANVDGLLPDRVLEVKTDRFGIGWGEPGTDEIPEMYLCQVTHYMAVTGRKLADVAVLVGGSDFRVYTVQQDPELEELIVHQEREFWKLVEAGTPPEATSYSDVKHKWGRKSASLVIQASNECLSCVEKLRDMASFEKNAKPVEEELKARIMAEMGNADTLSHGESILATWKMDKPGQKFSQDILKEKHPEIHKECMVDKDPNRRFLLKKEK